MKSNEKTAAVSHEAKTKESNGALRVLFPLGHDLGLGIVVFFRQFVTPMKQRLTHDGRHRRIVELLLLGIVHFGDEIIAPSSLDTGTSLPAPDFTFVVFGAATLEKPAIPLEPSIR